jgi:CubicO group peptidase (beta-lactamase class C family)
MEDFSTANCMYQYEPNKSEHPAYVFRMSARDMLRFGVLYQKGGTWLGRQIVSTSWITESTTTYSVVDSISGRGYGYMWDTIPVGTALAQLVGTTGYYHTGVGVHALIVLPELKLVIVERVNTDGAWVDPGDAGIELGLMIINGRI